MGCAIGVRYASEISPSRRLPRSGLNAGCTPILQPQSYTGERKAYVLFVFFVAKANRSSFAKGYGGQEGNKQ